ncbi:MAG: ABC transporter permease [Byssovorax sp.]
MRNALLLAQREIMAYLRSPIGYVVGAVALLIEGIYFYALGLSRPAMLSAQVLAIFFEGAAGTTMVLSALLAMRLIAGERENGTLVLLNTAPVREVEIVLGKFLAGLVFLSALAVLTFYMPLLIFVNGKVAAGHILVGYLGIVLLAAASLSIGLFASALASTQVVAVLVAGALLGLFFLIFFIAPATDPPINGFLSSMAIFHVRQRSFMIGMLKLENVVFNLAVAYVFLLATTKTLEARRWR